jgi:hypothetical protein
MASFPVMVYKLKHMVIVQWSQIIIKRPTAVALRTTDTINETVKK